MNSRINAPRLLIVDPSEAFRRIFAAAFADSSIEIQGCGSGHEALRLMVDQPFRAVVSSMVLEDMEGIELCLKTRQLRHYANVPFLLTTASDSKQAARAALPAGVTEIFSKSASNELIHFLGRYLRSQVEPIAGRVLLVEDNRSQREMLTEVFRLWGMTVTACEHAEDALMKLGEETFDLVVTDIVLSGVMNGLDLISRIRRIDGDKGDVPILAITGFDDLSRRIELFNLGVSDYAIKPIVGEELIARVRNLVTRRHPLRTGPTPNN